MSEDNVVYLVDKTFSDYKKLSDRDISTFFRVLDSIRWLSNVDCGSIKFDDESIMFTVENLIFENDVENEDIYSSIIQKYTSTMDFPLKDNYSDKQTIKLFIESIQNVDHTLTKHD